MSADIEKKGRFNISCKLERPRQWRCGRASTFHAAWIAGLRLVPETCARADILAASKERTVCISFGEFLPIPSRTRREMQKTKTCRRGYRANSVWSPTM
jgi:hypothetical protein